MIRFHSLGCVLGSSLMMLSLFLPLTWEFIPADVIWCFPFFDASIKDFSTSPSEYRCYPIRDILPFYMYPTVTAMLLVCKDLIPSMVVSIRKININIWGLHVMYVSIQAVDLFLAFQMIPIYRELFIIAGLVLHVMWLIDKK